MVLEYRFSTGFSSHLAADVAKALTDGPSACFRGDARTFERIVVARAVVIP